MAEEVAPLLGAGALLQSKMPQVENTKSLVPL